jgi:hypothetical protein
MSSWLSGLSASVGDLSNKVQAALPVDKEMLQKLTLTTPEMNAERQKMEEEEARRERVQQLLANIMPWETRDAEREILVEECKLAILNLSKNPDTFRGPYPLPPLPNTSRNEQEDQDEKEAGPSPESLVKLAKLEPLPTLLAEFDLDAHVGLIRKLLKEDPMLVEQQSKLSGAGDREWTFWRNYFFHCAFTRYEAGLSPDEIWSDDFISVQEAQEEEREETITFESSEQGHHENKGESKPSSLFDSPPTPTATSSSQAEKAGTTTTTADGSSTSGASSNDEGTDYEMIGGGEDNDSDSVELDELEAEIARELQD